MSATRVRIIRQRGGRMQVDIEAPPKQCNAAHEEILAILSLLGAAPVEISESPRAPAQPLQDVAPEKQKIGS